LILGEKLKRAAAFAFTALVLTALCMVKVDFQVQSVNSKFLGIDPSNSVVLSYDFSSPLVTGTVDDHVAISGLPSYGAPGEPVLPFKLVRLLIPQGKEVESVSIIPGNRTRLTGKFNVEYGRTLLPTSVNAIVEDKANETIYSSADPFPGKLYSQESVQYMRGHGIFLLRLYPVEYLPKTGELYYYQEMILNVDLKNGGESSSFFRGLPEDVQAIQSIVDNPNARGTYRITPDKLQTAISSPLASYKYVIVTSNALNFSFQPLITWKINKGVTGKTVLLEDIMKDPRYNSDGLFGDGNGSPSFNDTQAHIRNFIKDVYLNWGTEYVLLGGDDEIIPARGVYDYAGAYSDYNIPCDMYYGALDGSWDKDNDTIFGEAVYHWNGPENATAGEEADFFAEVYVGRATVDTPQETANFVNKTLAYEQSPQADYLKKSLMIGEKLDDVTQGANAQDSVTEIIPQYTTTRLYDRDGTYSKTAVINEINSGTHILAHDGHSNYRAVMGLTGSDVYALTNTQYFLVYSLGCFSAAFDTAISGTIEAVAEHFIFQPHGAFAYIGNSRYGWYCPASTDGPGERYERSFFTVLNSGTRNLGKALQLSKEQESLLDRWTCFTLNLLGDPETEIVTTFGTPTAHFKTRTDSLAPPHVGGAVTITGTAKRGTATGAAFSNFTVEFGNGTSPTSWMTNGITLASNGQSEVLNGTLATWNTSQVSVGSYTLRLRVFGSGLVGLDKWIVIVNNAAITVYIRADGTVDPPTAPINRNGNTYTLTASIFNDGDGIIIERDNVTLDGAGYTLQGTGSGVGVFLFGRSNVMIKNVLVDSMLYGISLQHSTNISILGCSTESGKFGIWLSESSNNNIVGNSITYNYYGLSLLSYSNNNTIVQNQIVENTGAYGAGVYLYISSNNSIHHNILVNNTIQQNSQVYDAAWDCADPGLIAPSINIWDDGYPSGGNYWSDYGGKDLYKGKYQNETGSDGIGDTPYVVDANITYALNNQDKYPMIIPQIHDIAVTNMTSSKTVVGRGYNVTIQAWTRNRGTFTETFNLTIEVAGGMNEVLTRFTNITLTSGGIVVVTYAWNTTSWPMGNYSVSVYVPPVQGETSIGDNTFTDGTITISIVGDITGRYGVPDGRVDMRDVGGIAKLFGVQYPDPNYNPNFDMNDDGKINMLDIGTVAKHFGEGFP